MKEREREEDGGERWVERKQTGEGSRAVLSAEICLIFFRQSQLFVGSCVLCVQPVARVELTLNI